MRRICRSISSDGLALSWISPPRYNKWVVVRQRLWPVASNSSDAAKDFLPSWQHYPLLRFRCREPFCSEPSHGDYRQFTNVSPPTPRHFLRRRRISCPIRPFTGMSVSPPFRPILPPRGGPNPSRCLRPRRPRRKANTKRPARASRHGFHVAMKNKRCKKLFPTLKNHVENVTVLCQNNIYTYKTRRKMNTLAGSKITPK